MTNICGIPIDTLLKVCTLQLMIMMCSFIWSPNHSMIHGWGVSKNHYGLISHIKRVKFGDWVYGMQLSGSGVLLFHKANSLSGQQRMSPTCVLFPSLFHREHQVMNRPLAFSATGIFLTSESKIFGGIYCFYVFKRFHYFKKNCNIKVRL